MPVLNVTRARKEKISKASLLAVADWNERYAGNSHPYSIENIRCTQQAVQLRAIAEKLKK